jgi:hypothetical protein
MEMQASEHLRIERPLPKGAPGRFARQSKSLRNQRVRIFSFDYSLAQSEALFFYFGVAQRRRLFFGAVDFRDRPFRVAAASA